MPGSLRKQRCGRLKEESVLSSTSACGIPGEAKVNFHIWLLKDFWAQKSELSPIQSHASHMCSGGPGGWKPRELQWLKPPNYNERESIIWLFPQHTGQNTCSCSAAMCDTFGLWLRVLLLIKTLCTPPGPCSPLWGMGTTEATLRMENMEVKDEWQDEDFPRYDPSTF